MIAIIIIKYLVECKFITFCNLKRNKNKNNGRKFDLFTKRTSSKDLVEIIGS